MAKKIRKGGKPPSFFYKKAFLSAFLRKDHSMMLKLILCFGAAAAFFIIPVQTVKENAMAPVFNVALDPGHGGLNVLPVEKYGDRYDRISGKYLEVFREGSQGGGFEESELMYRIASKVKTLLDKTCTTDGWESFRSIIVKYSSVEPKRIVINGFISRRENRPRSEILKLNDPNAEYRLFDYPGKGGETLPGRISYINSKRTHLSVSFHCAQSTSKDQVGMSAVICAPYSLMAKGLEVLQHKRTDPSFFTSSKYSSWFEERENRTLYRWFLSDTSMYFTGYPLDSSDSPNYQRFKGYRFNMVSWPYKDGNGWESAAAGHPSGTRYAKTLAGFVADGPYWEREKSKFEEYRRGEGAEGFGGDNLYASHELIRYTLTALADSGFKSPDLRLADPFLSVWSVPLYVNAIAAYVEFGYLREPVHQKMFRDKLDALAEGVAVGIYSLLAGTEPKDSQDKFRPKGGKIDFDKYRIDASKTYFDAAAQ
jgi:hypothetical protein